MSDPSVRAKNESTATINKPRVLGRPWLPIARAVWVLLALMILVVEVSLISRLGELLLVGDSVSRSFGALPQFITYPVFSRLVQWSRYALLAVYNLTALLIFWRKSDELMGLITSLLLLTLPFWFDLGGAIPAGCCEPGSPLIFTWALALLGLLLTIVFFNVFPSGQFSTVWARRLFWLGMALLGVGLITDIAVPEKVEAWSWWLQSGVLLGLLALGMVGQAYRYRRISGPVERQQTRWIVATMVLTLFWLLAIYNQTPFRSWSPWGGPWALLQVFGTLVVLALLPLSIARAILRYHLWDIDVIVRKTLVYTLLTGFLVLVYLGSVVALQGIFSRLTGQDSTLATILSTLLIAALFLPVRRRLQRAIDRRFYRRKYDAQKTLEQFAHTARDETDLDRLTAELVRVIQETMEPESVSVWLIPTADDRRQASGLPSADDGKNKQG